MNNDLISRKALWIAIKKLLEEPPAGSPEWNEWDQMDVDDMVFAAMKLVENAPAVDAFPITGDTSDGYHTFNELYHHRAILFSVICNSMPKMCWKSKKHHDGTMFDGMFIVGIDTPEGQATYHYDLDPYWNMFHVKEVDSAPEWDGHTPDEAIRRISTLVPLRSEDGRR